LKKKHNTNAFPAKTGDTVRVTRGDRKGFEGRIIRVDRKKFRVYVEGVTREKVDGTTIQIPVHPSKAMIVNLNLDDKWRREALKRKTGSLAKEIGSQKTKTVPEVAGEKARKEPAVKESRRRQKGTQEATRTSRRVRRKPKKAPKKDGLGRKKAKKAQPGQGVE
jgi:large subunit ribosomal protein L24